MAAVSGPPRSSRLGYTNLHDDDLLVQQQQGQVDRIF
jgi:hypothetical protein